MSDIASRLQAVRERIAAACARAGRPAASVTLVAVSKTHPAAAVRAAMAAGQLEFGENRVQELIAKARELADAAPRWHLIGSLQTNKVRDVLAVPGLTLVHSVDRIRLADELQQALAGGARTLDVLLQIQATDEPTKHGIAVADAPALLAHVQQNCARLRVRGLMAMGPLDGDPAPVFARVAALRDGLRKAAGLPLDTFSLGMSGDLEAAIAAGSTMVRVGSAVFGARG